ncbi:MAG TPA: thioesterase family protein [Kineosporiaceae bacterium]|nr:thioesterase family protein [Kineosporiaceae bacterium]
MTDFSTAVQLTAIGDLRWTANLPADWAQGRTTFGGLIGALAARAATLAVGAERPLRSLDLAFIAPLPAGPVEVDVELLGAGKAVTQLTVSFRSGGVLGARVHVVAGASRVSALRVETGPTEMVEGDPVEQGIDLPYVPGVMPDFGQHMEYRWCSEAFPFTGGGPETARVNGWARHRTVAEGLEAMIALLDAWPPVVLPMAHGPVPASTVRWAIQLASPDAGLNATFDAGKQWVWYEARTVQCADGYATAYASMFAEGRLLAWSEQLITIYDRPATEVPAEVVPPGVPA